MGAATLFTSGATSAATFSVAVAAAPLLFLVTAKSGSAAVFSVKKAAALQSFFLSKFSAAAATADKLLPRLFRFKFLRVTVRSLYCFFVFFALLLLPHYFSLVEQTMLSL